MARARTTRRAATPAQRKTPAPGAPANQIPALEWVSAGIGLALAATAIGFTAWDAAFGVAGPPAIEVRLKRVTSTPHGYVAEIEAINHGGAPAAQVEIEGVIAGSPTAEPSSVTIDYIPEGSSASGGLVFEQNPAGGALRLRAKGFADVS